MKTKTYTSKTLSYYYTYKLFVRTRLNYGHIINPTIKASATKLKGFNTMLLLQLLVLLEEHHKLNCTMNLALNYLNSGDG